MTNLKKQAEFYVTKGIWVYPYTNYRDSFNWIHWKGMDDSEYFEEFKTYDWDSAKGINIITGKQGVCVLYFSKDTNERYTIKSLETILSLLGLPNDYDWVYEGQTYVALVIKIDGDIWDLANKRYKEIKVNYKGFYPNQLPPGTLEHPSYASHFKWRTPRTCPTIISNTTLQKCLDGLNNIDLVDNGDSARNAFEKKKGLRVGCGCLTIIAMVAILVSMGVFDGEKLGFMETLLVFISMAALFAIGAYITRDT